MMADEYEQLLAASELRIEDEALNSYVERVLCETVGDDRCSGVRVYILNVPAFNATMSPNGAMTVWSGLLLRVRNEAQLGAVLGHEFAHFEQRHSLKGFEQRRGASDVMAWAAVLGGIGQTSTRDLQVSLVGSIFQFNRSQETEADLLGLQYLAQSRYSSRAASEVWQQLMEEADATAFGRKIKKRNRYRAGFFDTHPTSLNRAQYLLDQALEYEDSGDLRSDEHYEAIKPHLPKFLADQVRLNDFNGTEYILNGIAGTIGWTGELLHARAELFATRGNPRDLITSTTLYLRAIEAGYRTPETVRGLGLSLVKSGKQTEGAKYLREYIAEVPDAPDASIIRMYAPDIGKN
ncbi:M48 family metalloprotease [uncultured Parasphingorhabdus sp.]|uniref:M48 family metallopeptidase n=1 Tax=uncultured Parasphingorhabdus sp. TaxID=2709694 RepID=UPI002AA801E2|nr:M48 family metalloprotease [uncultured Parasphingorhabdus sp.]